VEISGTLTFAVELPARAQVKLAIGAGYPPSFGFASIITSALTSKPMRRATFTIHRLFPAKFSIFAFVDRNDDAKINAGDLVGYYDGTAEAPQLSTGDLKLVDAKGGSVSGVDFGIGLVK
jgi:hypothetical protein